MPTHPIHHSIRLSIHQYNRNTHQNVLFRSLSILSLGVADQSKPDKDNDNNNNNNNSSSSSTIEIKEDDITKSALPKLGATSLAQRIFAVTKKLKNREIDINTLPVAQFTSEYPEEITVLDL